MNREEIENCMYEYFGQEGEVAADTKKDIQELCHTLNIIQKKPRKLILERAELMMGNLFNKYFEVLIREESLDDKLSNLGCGEGIANVVMKARETSFKANEKKIKDIKLNKCLNEILKTFTELAQDENLERYLGDANAHEFKKKLDKINKNLSSDMPPKARGEILNENLNGINEWCEIKQVQSKAKFKFKELGEIFKSAILYAAAHFTFDKNREVKHNFNEAIKNYKESNNKFIESLKVIEKTVQKTQKSLNKSFKPTTKKRIGGPAL